MQNLLNKKETFIYQKYNSITNELCEDIIEIYNNTSDKNYIQYSSEFSKIKKYLINVLKQYLLAYKKKINTCKIFNFNFDLCNFIIEDSKSHNNIHYLHKFSKTTPHHFIYIWFLNDYDGQIIFFNDYKIIPKMGLFLLFPISWCFPYEELIKLNENRYIIYGYI